MQSNQPEFNFTPYGSLNPIRLGGQAARLYDYLAKGNTIHCFSEARKDLRIGYLNSRMSDIAHENVQVYKRNIKVPDTFGEMVTVTEYSLKPFEK